MAGAERRGAPRFELQLPVEVNAGNSTVRLPAVTRDVSARGIYFFMDAEVFFDSEFEFTLTLTPEITRTQCIRVQCAGHVIRIDRQGSDRIGLAARIGKHEFLSS
jgi:hypothetical protein